jgi:hypothetical protein
MKKVLLLLLPVDFFLSLAGIGQLWGFCSQGNAWWSMPLAVTGFLLIMCVGAVIAVIIVGVATGTIYENETK